MTTITNDPKEQNKQDKIFLVKPEMLRADAKAWGFRTLKLNQGRAQVPDVPWESGDSDGDSVTHVAYGLVTTYKKYCQQGEKEFVSIAESLQKAAKAYEDNEEEVF